jgi:hypothetical protein
MASADSFYQRIGDVTMVEARRLSNLISYSKIVNYVLARQNEDGGYCFAQGALESNGQDTYCGLAILKELNANFPNIEKTMQFLDENRIDSIYSMYYTARAQMLLGKGVSADLKKDVITLLDSMKYFGSSDFYSDSSEFESTLMAIKLADLLKIPISSSKVADWLYGFQNTDGGFGRTDHSNIDSTYHAVACLHLLKTKLDKQSILRFIRSCEKTYGGFTVIPVNINPYMEYTYYGIKTLNLQNEKSRYPSQTTDWILNCQKTNGGFARSDLGISTFVNTYQAIKILEMLNTK